MKPPSPDEIFSEKPTLYEGENKCFRERWLGFFLLLLLFQIWDLYFVRKGFETSYYGLLQFPL
jgi:hypothetical protein